MGGSGQGILNITDGGTLTSIGRESILGNKVGSSGVATVSGSNSVWSTYILTVGNRANSSVTVTDGGALTSIFNIYLGYHPGVIGTANVSGVGATFKSNQDIHVGYAGIGILNLSKGANLQATSSIKIASLDGSNGTFNIGGEADGTAVEAGNVSAASIQFGLGQGAINFNHTSDNFNLSSAISGSGKINQLAGYTTLSGNSGGFSGTTTVSGGTLEVNGTLNGNTSVGTNGTLSGKGTLANTVVNGVLSVGGKNANGVLTTSSLTLSSTATTKFDLVNPDNVAQNDRLQVNGDLQLGGTLQADVAAQGYYVLINYTGNLTGNFASQNINYTSITGTYDATVDITKSGIVDLTIAETGKAVQFWDGSGLPNDSVVSGGHGTWNTSSNNWATVDGVRNAAWQDNVGIFMGAAGQVGVVGAQKFDTLQFKTDGYVLSGDALVMESTSGIGTFNVDKNVAAEINNNIADGSANNFRKAGEGTLILAAANTFTGTTTISGGVLKTAVEDALAQSSGIYIAKDAVFDLDGYGQNVRQLSGEGNIELGRAMLTANNTDDSVFYGQINGSGSIKKLGVGNLTLSGENSYEGGTQILEGRLIATNGSALGTGSITNNSTLELAFNGDESFDNQVTGTGHLIKTGAGGANLNGDSSAYGGATTIESGRMSVNGVLGGTLTVSENGRLQGIGTVGTTINSGVIAPGNSIGTLTINGDYTGNNGLLELETVLGDDTSSTDKLIVTGDTAGVTNVKVINRGGLGAQTVEGIRVIDVAGASNGDFILNGDYKIQGQEAVVGGAYAYTLQKNGIADPADGDWYLRSQLVNPPTVNPDPTEPQPPITNPEPTGPKPQNLYQAGVPLYEAYPQTLLAMNTVSTLQQRVGNRYWGGENLEQANSNSAKSSTVQWWARADGNYLSIDPDKSTSNSQYDTSIYRIQAGLDGMLFENQSGKLIGGITVHYVHGQTNVSSSYGDGKINTDGYGFGATLTWYGDNGFYVDGQSQFTWYDSDLESKTAYQDLTDGNDGFGYVVSAETGKRFTVSPGFTITPQAQLIYSSVDFDSFTDIFSARISQNDSDSLRGRIGLMFDREQSWNDDKGQARKSHIFGIVNIYNEFLDGTQVTVKNGLTGLDAVSFTNKNARTWGGVGFGGTYAWANEKYSLYGQMEVNTSFDNSGDNYSVGGFAGFRAKF